MSDIAGSAQPPTAYEGDLRSAPLPRVLYRLAVGRETGILTIQGEDDIVAVSLLEGDIVTADALNQTVEEGLGEVVVSRGLVTREDFAGVVREHQGGAGGSLADLLVDRGLVERGELLDAMRLQTYRLMLQVLGWSDGEFKFYGGDEVSYEEGFQPISVAELLVRAKQDVGDASGLAGALPLLDGVYQPVKERGELKVFGRDGDGEGEGPWVSELEAKLLQHLDGVRSAWDGSRAAGIDRYRATFALYRLRGQRLIRELRADSAGDSTGVGAVARTLRPASGADLKAEIFLPPDLAAGAAPPAVEELSLDDGYDEADVETAPAVPRDTAGLVRRAMRLVALLVAVALVAALVRSPVSFVVPFPWQDPAASPVVRDLRASLFQRIDRAARVFFLEEAHYPDSLGELVERGLLSPADLRGPTGLPLDYSTHDVRYQITLVDRSGGEVPHLAASEAITGDFLLDPQFSPVEAASGVPLVLLD